MSKYWKSLQLQACKTLQINNWTYSIVSLELHSNWLLHFCWYHSAGVFSRNLVAWSVHCTARAVKSKCWMHSLRYLDTDCSPFNKKFICRWVLNTPCQVDLYQLVPYPSEDGSTSVLPVFGTNTPSKSFQLLSSSLSSELNHSFNILPICFGVTFSQSSCSIFGAKVV